jgi:hypothetical protein
VETSARIFASLWNVDAHSIERELLRDKIPSEITRRIKLGNAICKSLRRLAEKLRDPSLPSEFWQIDDSRDLAAQLGNSTYPPVLERISKQLLELEEISGHIAPMRDAELIEFLVSTVGPPEPEIEERVLSQLDPWTRAAAKRAFRRARLTTTSSPSVR